MMCKAEDCKPVEKQNNISYFQSPWLFIAAMDSAYIRWLREIRQEETRAHQILRNRMDMLLRIDTGKEAKRNVFRRLEHERIARVLEQAKLARLQAQQELEKMKQELEKVKENRKRKLN